MATRFLKISSNGNKIFKSKLIKAASYIIIFNFSFPFSIDTLEYDKTASSTDEESGGVSYLIAKKNKGKNQNQDVIAQDGNRVVLTAVSSQPDQEQGDSGDYINATRLNMEENYLDRTWIVTQGPMDNTIGKGNKNVFF